MAAHKSARAHRSRGLERAVESALTQAAALAGAPNLLAIAASARYALRR
jgi:hypothetical protein